MHSYFLSLLQRLCCCFSLANPIKQWFDLNECSVWWISWSGGENEKFNEVRSVKFVCTYWFGGLGMVQIGSGKYCSYGLLRVCCDCGSFDLSRFLFVSLMKIEGWVEFLPLFDHFKVSILWMWMSWWFNNDDGWWKKITNKEQ